MWGTYETYATCRSLGELLRWLGWWGCWGHEKVRAGVEQASKRLRAMPRDGAIIAIPPEDIGRYGFACMLCLAHFPRLPAWAAFLGRGTHLDEAVGTVSYCPRIDVIRCAASQAARRALYELDARDVLAAHGFVAPRGVTSVEAIFPNFAYAARDWADEPFTWWVCTRVGAVRARLDFYSCSSEPERLASALGVPVDLAARLVEGDPDEADAEFAMIVLACEGGERWSR